LLLEDLQLGLNDLLTKREQLLLGCSNATTYATLLRVRRDAIEALCDILVGGDGAPRQHPMVPLPGE
jgi:hypothetical protein